VAGSTFSLARSGGAIFTFGSNTNSELGRGAVGTSPTPAPIVGLDQVTFADAGYSHACVVRQGAIVCWGDNGSGQLGLGDKANRAVPVTVTLP
jgi:alpha-tubulin suppressor-like RCC1 family protein